MHVKSSQRAGRRELAKHLISDENEQVRIVQSRGVVDSSISGALAEFEAIATGSNCKKFMFHVSASPAPDEQMSEKHWEVLWKNHEKINGLENASFVQVEHQKKNRTHQHRVYLRVDSQTGKAVNLAWTRLKNERLSRMCEAHFGHKIIQGKFNRSVIKHLKKDGFKTIAAQLEASGIANNDPRVTQITHNEGQQIKNGFDIKQARAAVADCWAQSDNAQAFKAALSEAGFALADGDKAGIPVVLDRDGHVLPLLRAVNTHRKIGGLDSIRKKEFMKMISYPLQDVDAVREQLPELSNLQTLSQQAEVTEDIKAMMNQNPKQKGQISHATKTPSSQKNDKHKLLEEHYGQQLQGLELSRFWKVDRLSDGSLQLKNKAGTVTDNGDSIDVQTTGKQFPTAAAALQLAALKDWDQITITGTDEFKKAAYSLAIESGIDVQINNDHDRSIYERIQETSKQQKNIESNTIEKAENNQQQKNTEVAKFFEDGQQQEHEETNQTHTSNSPRIK